MDHLIVVRMKYLNDENFFKRDEVRLKTFIPSILNQINKNFKIGFIINTNHVQIIREHFKNSNINILFFNSSNDVRNYVMENDVKIQTRIDDDDIISCEYTDLLQKMYNHNIVNYESFLIQTQPFKFLLSSGEFYKMGLRYGNETTSMFLTLCQKNVSKFIMDRPHNKMGGTTDCVLSTNEGICSLVITNNNNVSDIKKYDKQIEVTDLSVIVPTFNNVDYIDECLMSIIESSKEYNFEILVGIDNCEKTLEYVKNHQDKYHNTKFYLFKDSVGPYVIKNTLTQISNSNNIIFFDSDDIMNQECVPTIMGESEKYGSIRFSFNNFIELNKPYKNKIHAEGVFFIKKSYFNFLNGFEPWKCAADSEFHRRVVKNDIKTCYLNNIMFLRRIHDVSLTNKTETGYKSNVRWLYSKIIKEKQKSLNYKPLPNLTIHTFFYVNGDNLELVSDKTNFNFFDELNHVSLINNQSERKPKYLTFTPEKKTDPIIPKDFNPNRPRPVVIPIDPEPKKPTIQKAPEKSNEIMKIKNESLVDLSRKIGLGKGRKSPNKLYM